MAFFYSKKQAGQIYKAWKSGKVEASKETIDFMYQMAERMVGGNGYSEQLVLDGQLRKAVDAILGWNDYEKAQRHLDAFAENMAESLDKWGAKFAANAAW